MLSLVVGSEYTGCFPHPLLIDACPIGSDTVRKSAPRKGKNAIGCCLGGRGSGTLGTLGSSGTCFPYFDCSTVVHAVSGGVLHLDNGIHRW